MQDIDFDELDRAVNSVSGTDTSDTTNSSANPVVTPRPDTPASPAARRSSGRFMDVVHPSSDMRPPARTISSPSDTPTQASTQPTTKPTAATTTETADSFQWPDPIEMAGTQSESEAAPTTPEPSIEESPAQPLDSPFLPDAKVEKRPLGSPPAFDFSNMNEPDEPQKSETTMPSDDDAPMPAELNEDIVKLEETETPVEPPATTAAESTASTPAAEEPIGPTSITQQYKEQPSTTQQPSGAIYDTETYHQPLAHTEKKHSGILVIIWIVALILVGGGAGAGVYFFVLPML